MTTNQGRVLIRIRRSLVFAGSMPVLLLLLMLGVSSPGNAASYRPVGWATRGMVVSDCSIASDVGVQIMKEGGNAIDAAVATGFVLAVVFPNAGNLGGGGFAVVHLAQGDDLTLDFRETAPAGASRDMYLDAEGNVIPGLSLFSHLAVGVPGSVDGLLRLWRDHGSGKITRDRLLSSAVQLAQEGFEVDQDLAGRLNEIPEITEQEAATTIFRRTDGRSWRPGDRLVQTDLAASLERIAEQGRDGFYGGKTAEFIIEEMNRGGGILSPEDLTDYRSVYRPPVHGMFRGYDVVTMGPPSSGGILVVQILNMLTDRPLVELGWNSTDYVHLLTEVERRAYADRAEHFGDPDFWDVPTHGLLSKSYARSRAADISMTVATPSVDVNSGEPPGKESTETTHFSVIDGAGNAVSITTTLNASFGSGIVAAGTGILLNDEMDDFSSKPGVPNYYGLVGNEANAIEPKKRMLSSMSPTLVLRDGDPVLILGSPGGSKIITSVVQVILNTLVFEMPIAQAVEVPRVHSQWLPDKVFIESFGLAGEIVEKLIARGHEVAVYPGPIGRVNALRVREDGIYAGPDTRGACAASGY